MVVSDNVMARLRSETADAHARVDALVDLEDLSRARYVALLRGFRRSQAAVEDALAVHAQTLGAFDYDVIERSKIQRLNDDLSALGEDVAKTNDRLELADAGAAFGAVYVVEGSTLGAKIIARHAESLGISPAHGGNFLHGYGERTGTMWKRTGQSITSFADRHPTCEGSMLAGAHATFALFEHCLTEELNGR